MYLTSELKKKAKKPKFTVELETEIEDLKIGEPVYKVKRIHKDNTWGLTRYIIAHLRHISNAEAWIFPSRSRPHVETVKYKGSDGKQRKTYRYQHTTAGHMNRFTAYKILKVLAPEFHPHYFRKSLATQLAEEHANPIILLKWFDWDSYDTAMGYIEESGVITEKVSRREVFPKQLPWDKFDELEKDSERTQRILKDKFYPQFSSYLDLKIQLDENKEKV